MNKAKFDDFAENYRDLHSKSLQNLTEFDSTYFAKYKIDIVKKTLGKIPLKILDFGCGDGLGCEMLSKCYPDAEIIGLDVSSQSIDHAQKRALQNCNFICYDGENFDLEKNPFDLIFSSGVFHHIDKEKHSQILKSLLNLMKQDASMFIFEHNPLNPLTQKVVDACVFDKDAVLINPKEFSSLLKGLGVKNYKINYTLFVPRYKIFQKLFFIDNYLKKLPIGAQYYVHIQK